MRPYVDEDLCTGCGACYDVCPAEPNVFEIEEVAKVVNPDECTGCGACEQNCPVDAIQLEE